MTPQPSIPDQRPDPVTALERALGDEEYTPSPGWIASNLEEAGWFLVNADMLAEAFEQVYGGTPPGWASVADDSTRERATRAFTNHAAAILAALEK